ncbi:MAG TPA: hypothetical protein VIV15_10020 [Anaerolineales bacterium]
MNDSYSLLAILIGLSLRLALPVAVTIVAIYLLRKLDLHWQEQAELERNQPVAEKVQCWDLKDCPIEKQNTCAALTSPQPCWQVKRLPNGYMREECLTCAIFRNAPVPAQHRTEDGVVHAHAQS